MLLEIVEWLHRKKAQEDQEKPIVVIYVESAIELGKFIFISNKNPLTTSLEIFVVVYFFLKKRKGFQKK